MRSHYRSRVDGASEVETLAIHLLIEHGEYSEDDYEADADELNERRADALESVTLFGTEWDEEGLLQAA